MYKATLVSLAIGANEADVSLCRGIRELTDASLVKLRQRLALGYELLDKMLKYEVYKSTDLSASELCALFLAELQNVGAVVGKATVYKLFKP